MIYMDPRVGGGKEQREHSIQQWVEHTQAVLSPMEFGDFAIPGDGPDGPVVVGIEFKTVDDFLNSLDSGRLTGHQIPGLVDNYGFRYLIIEGGIRSDERGRLLVYRNREWVTTGWMHQAILDRIDDITVQAGVHCIRTFSRSETYLQLKALHSSWSKPWAERSSLHTVYSPAPPITLPRPTQAMKFAHTFDGVGWDRAKAAAKHFGSCRKMAAAREKQWREVPGIGKVLAKRIDEALGEA